MAHLWLEESRENWAVIPLESSRIALERLVARGHAPTTRHHDGHETILLRDDTHDRPAWHLLALPNRYVRVNGIPLTTGVRVIADRDEIALSDGSTFFFSTEQLACVSAMPETSRAMMCPRCRQRIDKETPAVRCPQCGLWHHQSDEFPCWTYATTCAMCPQPSALDAGYQWTPTEL